MFHRPSIKDDKQNNNKFSVRNALLGVDKLQW